MKAEYYQDTQAAAMAGRKAELILIGIISPLIIIPAVYYFIKEVVPYVQRFLH